MNLQLHRVISDITGTTGMAIIHAIVTGERNPQVLAALKNPRIKSSVSEIAHALTGDYRVGHIFVLQQELQFYEVFQKAIAECDQKIEQYLSLDALNLHLNVPKPLVDTDSSRKVKCKIA